MFRPLMLQPKPYPANQYNVLGVGKLKREATLSGLQAEVEAIHARAVERSGTAVEPIAAACAAAAGRDRRRIAPCA